MQPIAPTRPHRVAAPVGGRAAFSATTQAPQPTPPAPDSPRNNPPATATRPVHPPTRRPPLHRRGPRPLDQRPDASAFPRDARSADLQSAPTPTSAPAPTQARQPAPPTPNPPHPKMPTPSQIRTFPPESGSSPRRPTTPPTPDSHPQRSKSDNFRQILTRTSAPTKASEPRPAPHPGQNPTFPPRGTSGCRRFPDGASRPNPWPASCFAGNGRQRERGCKRCGPRQRPPGPAGSIVQLTRRQP